MRVLSVVYLSACMSVCPSDRPIEPTVLWVLTRNTKRHWKTTLKCKRNSVPVGGKNRSPGRRILNLKDSSGRPHNMSALGRRNENISAHIFQLY